MATARCDASLGWRPYSQQSFWASLAIFRSIILHLMNRSQRTPVSAPVLPSEQGKKIPTSRSIISSPERATEIIVFPISGFPWLADFGLMARLTLPIRKSATYQPSCCAPDKERSNSDNKPDSLSAALVSDLSGTWSPVRLNPMFRSFICAAFLHGTARGSEIVRKPGLVPMAGIAHDSRGAMVGQSQHASNTLASARGDPGSAVRDDHPGGGPPAPWPARPR